MYATRVITVDANKNGKDWSNIEGNNPLNSTWACTCVVYMKWTHAFHEVNYTPSPNQRKCVTHRDVQTPVWTFKHFIVTSVSYEKKVKRKLSCAWGLYRNELHLKSFQVNVINSGVTCEDYQYSYTTLSDVLTWIQSRLDGNEMTWQHRYEQRHGWNIYIAWAVNEQASSHHTRLFYVIGN